MITITLGNAGGTLDVRTVRTSLEVRAALLDIIAGINDYYPGDWITVSGDEEEADGDETP